MKNTENLLTHLDQLIRSNDYESRIEKRSQVNLYDTIVVRIKMQKSESESKVEIIYFPRVKIELDNTDLVQFYFQFPYELTKAKIDSVRPLLPHLNSRISIGYLSVNETERKIQYKYVYAHQQDIKPNPTHFLDVFEIFYYTPCLHEATILNYLKGILSLEAAIEGLETR